MASLIVSICRHPFPVCTPRSTNTTGSTYHIGFTICVHVGSAQQAGQQGNQGNADQGNSTTGHKLLYALRLGAGVVLAISFQKVDAAPNTERTAKGYNEGLQSFDCRVEEFHIVSPFPTHFVPYTNC